MRVDYIYNPFPNGESYEQTTEKIHSFLADLVKNFDGKKVLIIGHMATHYGLEYCINKTPLMESVSAPWHWKWRQSWTYKLKRL